MFQHVLSSKPGGDRKQSADKSAQPRKKGSGTSVLPPRWTKEDKKKSVLRNEDDFHQTEGEDLPSFESASSSTRKNKETSRVGVSGGEGETSGRESGPSGSTGSAAKPENIKSWSTCLKPVIIWTPRLQKYVVYETKTRYYVVGSNWEKTSFSVLKVDRTHTNELHLLEDEVEYTMHELRQLLNMVNQGNQAMGGGSLKKICTAYGILGFIRFLQGYYMIMITKRRIVGKMGYHKIYAIVDTEMIYIPQDIGDTVPEELKYKDLLYNMDLTNFYFSYTYDLTHTLQHNMTEATASSPAIHCSAGKEHNSSVCEQAGKGVATGEKHHGKTPIERKSIESVEGRKSQEWEGRKRGHGGTVENPSMPSSPRTPAMRRIKRKLSRGQIMSPHLARLGLGGRRNTRIYQSMPVPPNTATANYNVSGVVRAYQPPPSVVGAYDPSFVWNDYLFGDLLKGTEQPAAPPKDKLRGAYSRSAKQVGTRLKKIAHRGSKWTLPMIHGYYDQSKMIVGGREIVVTLIARRSRHFAGTRFLKRGVNDKGKVANDVETEQIVEESSRTHIRDHSHFTSFVQIRGSIPLYWGQDGSIMAPKPPIFVTRMDPFYTSSILHFQDLFRRFGTPIITLNLVKSTEKKRREGILRQEFTDLMVQINATLPDEYKIMYIPWDFHKSAKSKVEDVISIMNEIAYQSIRLTGFFHSGPQLPANKELRGKIYPDEGGVPYSHGMAGRFQTGVVRSNCIDSLDRTNAAQYVTGKVAYGWQLYALGIIPSPMVDFDDDIVSVLVDMYQAMGNTLAVQYGGSNLAHTISTYRNQSIASKSRDLFTTITRFYSNTFSDKQKQDSINIYLGNYVPWRETQKHQKHLWDLETDYYLHMQKGPAFVGDSAHLLNTQWWMKPVKTFNSRLENVVPLFPFAGPKARLGESPLSLVDVYFNEYYRPTCLTSFDEKLSHRWNIPVYPDIRGRYYDSQVTKPVKSSTNLDLTDASEITEANPDPLSYFSTSHKNSNGILAGGGSELDEEDDEDYGIKSENMLAWGVKRWLNFHYKTTKQTNIFEDYRAPVGTALRNPLTKEKYDYVPNVYAREEYGIRLENAVSAADLAKYESYQNTGQNIQNGVQVVLPDECLQDYSRWLTAANECAAVTAETLETIDQATAKVYGTFVENYEKLAKGKALPSQRSELMYHKYCKETSLGVSLLQKN